MLGDEGRAEASIPREEQKVGRGSQEECIVMLVVLGGSSTRSALLACFAWPK